MKDVDKITVHLLSLGKKYSSTQLNATQRDCCDGNCDIAQILESNTSSPNFDALTLELDNHCLGTIERHESDIELPDTGTSIHSMDNHVLDTIYH